MIISIYGSSAHANNNGRQVVYGFFASSAANGGADSAGYSLLKSCRLEELESRDFEDGGAGGEKTAFSLRSFFT